MNPLLDGFEFHAWGEPAKPEKSDEPERKDDARTRIQCFKTEGITKKMRILSEAALADAAPWHFEDGVAYHFITAGDVDSLTFLRHVLRQQRADYVLLSTWCMSTRDAEEMRRWLDDGLVGRFDFYVGEIFKDGYRGCVDVLCDIADRCGGRVARFRNHSKLMAVYGERFTCVIESSANVDTNPRTEQACITMDAGLADFYKDYFDGVRDFDGRYKEWEPWQR